MDQIDITIVDPNITLDSMNITLGKLIMFKEDILGGGAHSVVNKNQERF